MKIDICRIFYCDKQCEHTAKIIDAFLAIIFAALTIYVSVWNISKHLKYFTQPHFQSKIICNPLQLSFPKLLAFRPWPRSRFISLPLSSSLFISLH